MPYRIRSSPPGHKKKIRAARIYIFEDRDSRKDNIWGIKLKCWSEPFPLQQTIFTYNLTGYSAQITRRILPEEERSPDTRRLLPAAEEGSASQASRRNRELVEVRRPGTHRSNFDQLVDSPDHLAKHDRSSSWHKESTTQIARRIREGTPGTVGMNQPRQLGRDPPGTKNRRPR